jgi:uncharacterized membrane protein (UPF0127 family)
MSVRKDVWSWGIVALVLVLIGVAAYWIFWPQLSQPYTKLRVGDGVFKARVADSPDEREKGLSGTPQLAQDQALLFVYDRDDEWSIWMKDMSYSIDIVWLDKDKKVVHIVKNAQPESYPHESFSPNQSARYIVEFVAGTVDKKTINIGDVAAFDETQLEGWGV